MTDFADTRARLTRIFTLHLGVDADKVTDSARVIEDLDADSLDGVEIVMAIEEEFAVEVTDDDGDALYQGTFGEAVALVERKLAAKAEDVVL